MGVDEQPVEPETPPAQDPPPPDDPAPDAPLDERPAVAGGHDDGSPAQGEGAADSW